MTRQLYPRSGVGVVAPWLLIAPADYPVIRIDLRVIDRVSRINQGVHHALDDADLQCVEHPDFLERLGRRTIPTLVVHGEHDTRPVSAARELAARMPGAEVLVVPRAGHYPWIEAPEVLRAAFLDFVRRIAR